MTDDDITATRQTTMTRDNGRNIGGRHRWQGDGRDSKGKLFTDNPDHQGSPENGSFAGRLAYDLAISVRVIRQEGVGESETGHWV